MRLTAIKLAGFKSFVDPTALRLPGNLIGVVGPNGCGKSNVIDAVRWVTGETSAKQLRGSALQDVIFNGSRSRKPVGRASVELIFDNSEGKLGGQYAGFSEISVRREASRDGESRYFINGSRSRRRDIVDLFLGTGLGGRNNYAIIEQGMISRMIESKPEEVRLILEEAAGISKYKERRRETENRIRSTRENLDRINDLRSELTQRLAQLKRQSENAEKFHKYKKEERLLKAELLFLKWSNLDAESGQHRQTIEAAEGELQSKQSALQAAESERERQRISQNEANHACQEAQGAYYAAEAEVSRLEQALAHAREMREVQRRELSGLTQQIEELGQRSSAEKTRHDEALARIEALEKQVAAATANEAELREQVLQAERDAQQALDRWEHFNAESQAPLQQAEAEKARVEQLERQIEQTRKRREKLAEERAGLAPEELKRQLKASDEEYEQLNQSLKAAQQTLERHEAEIAKLRDQRSELEGQLHEARQGLQSLKGRLSSLEALQQAALKEDDPELQSWLEARNWQDMPRLAQQIEVADGWEAAVEAVLGHLLQALSMPALNQSLENVDAWPDAALVLVDNATSGSSQQTATLAGAVALGSHVRAPDAILGLLAQVYCAESLADARARVGQLQPGQILVTPEGHCLGPGWLRHQPAQREDGGIIAREQSMKQLQQEWQALSKRVASLESDLAGLREQINHLQGERGQLAERVETERRKHAECLASRRASSVRLEQTLARAASLEAELKELEDQHQQQGADMQGGRDRLSASLAKVEQVGSQRQALQEELKRLRETLHRLRESREHAVSERQRLEVDLAAQRSAQRGSDQNLKDYAARRQALQAQLEQGEQALQNAQQPQAENETHQAEVRGRRDQAKQALEVARKHLAEIEGQAEAAMRQVQAAEQTVQAVRGRLEQARLAFQGIDVRRQTLEEQIGESGYALEALRENIAEDASIGAWEEQLEAMERRIQRLGPINLAAIGEYEEQQQRETYLIEQHADLTQALETLETAIRKIDKETRTRFRETFDAVNGTFKEIFPKLFGGGEAFLELTGEDLLDTGVKVMARPPGKRNSSIQMLSGGEKAMTAVALLFALFKLNPAPFCMLDEVDAPLDDANVARFCNLVRDMSENVQFIVITHNKITMELMYQLNGVTMQEPGVSRLVSVDVDQAVEMAG